MYYRNRYYQPTHGRFLTSDPLGEWRDSVAGGNSYSYVGCKPHMLIDAMGLQGHGLIVMLGSSHTLNEDISDAFRVLSEHPQGGDIVIIPVDPDGVVGEEGPPIPIPGKGQRLGKEIPASGKRHGSPAHVIVYLHQRQYQSYARRYLGTNLLGGKPGIKKIGDVIDDAVGPQGGGGPPIGPERPDGKLHSVVVFGCHSTQLYMWQQIARGAALAPALADRLQMMIRAWDVAAPLCFPYALGKHPKLPDGGVDGEGDTGSRDVPPLFGPPKIPK